MQYHDLQRDLAFKAHCLRPVAPLLPFRPWRCPVCNRRMYRRMENVTRDREGTFIAEQTNVPCSLICAQTAKHRKNGKWSKKQQAILDAMPKDEA